MSTSTTTPRVEGTPGPSIRPGPGDLVLVRIGDHHRPMIVTVVTIVPIYTRIAATVENPQAEAVRREVRLSGTIFCEPEDHTAPAFRGALDQLHDPARIHGRPDRLLNIAYAECLRQGSGVGEWLSRPGPGPAVLATRQGDQ
jgi:hypothetical protein